MLFNTPQYIIFLPIVVIIYYLLPKKMRNFWLLISSYYFYMQWNPFYITLLISCTLLTFLAGIQIETVIKCTAGNRNDLQQKMRKRQKLYLVCCIVFILGMLCFFKYFNLAIGYLNLIISNFHMNGIHWNYDILLPAGISFYLLQSLGYLIDVYRGEISAEKNFVDYAVFISFFPQLVAGPIERSRHLLTQLHESHPFKYENFRKGSLMILYGLFLKMVIADRASIIVDAVYGESAAYPGFYIAAATAFFAIQIYCDFYGYSTIARGSALLMGVELMDNFAAPYYSGSIKEFWRRWHISLSGWFRDYLYIPLGGNRKGNIRKNCNLLAVFGISGLWHGASLAFLVWGLLHGIYQIAENAVNKVKTRIHKFLNNILPGAEADFGVGGGTNRFSRRLFQRVFTFLLVTFAWLFFRAGGLHESMVLLRQMFGVNNWTVLFDGSLYSLGVAKNYMRVMLLSILVLFIVDYKKYKGIDVIELFFKQGWCFRVLGVMGLVFSILLYGCYGTMYEVRQFIYFQF